MLTRYTMHVNLDILHPHFPKYEKERLQIPKTRFANKKSCTLRIPISAFAKSEKLAFAHTGSHPLQISKNSRLQILYSGVSNSQNMRMKDHAVMKTSSLVRFRLPVTSGSHTRHKLDQRSDEVRLRLSRSGAHRPQTYTYVS